MRLAGFGLIVLGVVGTFTVDSEIGYAVMIAAGAVLLINWQQGSNRRDGD